MSLSQKYVEKKHGLQRNKSAQLHTVASFESVPNFQRFLAQNVCIMPVTFTPSKLFLGERASGQNKYTGHHKWEGNNLVLATHDDTDSNSDSNDTDSNSDSYDTDSDESDNSQTSEPSNGSEHLSRADNSEQADVARRTNNKAVSGGSASFSAKRTYVICTARGEALASKTSRGQKGPLKYHARSPAEAARKAFYAKHRSTQRHKSSNCDSRISPPFVSSSEAVQARAIKPPAANKRRRSSVSKKVPPSPRAAAVRVRVAALLQRGAVTAHEAAAYLEAWDAAKGASSAADTDGNNTSANQVIREKVFVRAFGAARGVRSYDVSLDMVTNPSAGMVRKRIVRETRALKAD